MFGQVALSRDRASRSHGRLALGAAQRRLRGHDCQRVLARRRHARRRARVRLAASRAALGVPAPRARLQGRRVQRLAGRRRLRHGRQRDAVAGEHRVRRRIADEHRSRYSRDVGGRPSARRRRRVRRAARRSAGQSAVAAAARRPVVVPVRHGELRARRAHGIEATVDWQATQRLELSAAVGWLRAEIDEFSLFPELAGREQAHAPAYTYSLGATYARAVGLVGAARLVWHGRVLLRLRPRSSRRSRTASRI